MKLFTILKCILASEYIVVLKPHFNIQTHIIKTNEEILPYDMDFSIKYVFEDLLPAYVAELDQRGKEYLETKDEVAYIEENQTGYIDEISKSWGLARVYQEGKLESIEYNYPFNASSGTGVNVYVLDTGINIQHEDFNQKAKWGINILNETIITDDKGHGTHVAGTIGGHQYGVSKNTTLYAVKVLDLNGRGKISDVIKGLQWTINHIKSGNGGIYGNVINMSLGFWYSQALYDAIELISESIICVVSAGNLNGDSCQRSPASSLSAVTVAASNLDDYKAEFSNYGSCVDVIAPGVNIVSLSNRINNATLAKSGTSMASPHVAGIAANLFSYYRDLTPRQVKELIIKNGINNIISGFNNETANVFAHHKLNL